MLVAMMTRAAMMLAALHAGAESAFVPLEAEPRTGPYYLLDPASYAAPLGADLAWATWGWLLTQGRGGGARGGQGDQSL
jgi:hypothetical protein